MLLAPKDHRVFREKQVQQDQLAHKVHRDLRAILVTRDQLVLRVQLVQQVQQDRKERLA